MSLTQDEKEKLTKQLGKIRETIAELNRLNSQAQDIHRQAILTMTETNSTEQTISRLRNELLDDQVAIIDKLDKG